MELNLLKKPKNARLVIGYPGFGLVGTITSGFLVEHCQCERIGSGYFSEIPATIALHGGKISHPIDIFYSKAANLVIMHTIVPLNQIDWKASEFVEKLVEELAISEIITIEGVAGQGESLGRAYFFTEGQKQTKALTSAGALPMNEGIIMGLSSALVIRKIGSMILLFAETHADLPDSKAAAKMIEILDKYLDLDVDYKPLLKQAASFESKIKEMLEQRKQVAEQKDKHQMNYIS